jgi:hypothetical protein
MAGMPERKPRATAEVSFSDHSARVLDHLRGAVATILSAVPELTTPRPVDIAERLGIDNKLAWKIANVVDGEDPFKAARYIPGTAAFRIFLRAAASRDVPKAMIASAKAAFGSYRDLVDTHAGSRHAFDMMLAGHAHEERVRADLEHRRLMFLGSSYVWGLQARVVLRTDLLAPSDDPMMFDAATIRGFIDLRRLRPDVPWRIARGYSADDAGGIHTSFVREALAAELNGASLGHDAPLMPAFCSRPLPEYRRVDAPGGTIEYELVEGAVGNTGILTCVTGELLRRVEPRYRTGTYHDISQMLRMRTPCELAIFDVLIHRSLFGRRIEPKLVVYSDLFAEQTGPRYRTCDVLPTEEQVEYLGMDLEAAEMGDVPRYSEMVRCALDRGGWDAKQFDVFRVRMRYPPIPVNLIITHDLPDPPPGMKLP